MRNRYLEDRAMRRKDYRNRPMRDGRNPYGSAGGYVRDYRYGNDSRMDYNYDYAERNRGYDYRNNYESRNSDYNKYPEHYGEYNRPMYDYEMRNRDYNYDYRMDYDHMEKEYHEELKKWIEKLKQKDNRIRVNKEQVMRQAKNMNVRFEDYTEEEFYAVYLMMIADYPNVTNDYNVYLSMAKNWLEDDDVKVKGSDKLCTYLYEIVLGKSKEDDD
jgi:hypothetical protein